MQISSVTCGAQTNSVTSVKFDPSGRHIASASADKSCCVYTTGDTTGAETPSVVLSGHADGLNDVIWLHTPGHVATASDDNSIKLWDIENGTESATLHGHENAVFCLAIHPQHNILVSGSYDESIKLWDVRCSKSCIYSIEAHSEPVSSVHFSSTGDNFVSGSYDNMIRMWDMRYGQCLKTLAEPSQLPICSVRFMPNEDYLMMSTLSNSHQLIDLRSELPQHLIHNSRRDNNAEFCKIIRQYTGHKNVTHSVFVNHFDFDGVKYLISGSEDNRACVWNLDTEELVCSIDGAGASGAIIALDVHHASGAIVVGGFGGDFSVRTIHLKNDDTIVVTDN